MAQKIEQMFTPIRSEATWAEVARLYDTQEAANEFIEHKFDRKREQLDHRLFDIITGPIDNDLYVR